MDALVIVRPRYMMHVAMSHGRGSANAYFGKGSAFGRFALQRSRRW